MSISNKKKRAVICYYFIVLCYTFVSLLIFNFYGGFHYKNGVPSSRPYNTEIGMFSIHENMYGGNGKVQTHKEVYGYIMEMKVYSCGIDNGTCSTSYQDYPASMKFVYVALFWQLIVNFFVYTPISILPIISTKRLCKVKTRTLDIVAVSVFICTCVFHVLGYIVYVQVIGKDVGFSWNNLTHVVYIGVANACCGPVVLMLLILLYRTRTQSSENGLIYIKYKKIKSAASKAPCRTEQHDTNTQTIPQSRSTQIIYCPLDIQTVAGDIRKLLETLWKPAKVGIGRDAKGLYHSSINITNITSIGNVDVFQLYSKRKRRIENFADSVGGQLTPLEQYSAATGPIQTDELVRNNSSLVKVLNLGINEHYLFHGTPITNLQSIERYGFFMEKYKHSMLGKGIYFTEDPVKADQYTGQGNEVKEQHCCMILCRVLLGNSLIQRRSVKHPAVTSTATTAPCKTCLKPKPGCHCRKYSTFDSVMFEGLLFREFVVYETCSCFPEFAVIYERVKRNAYPMLSG